MRLSFEVFGEEQLSRDLLRFSANVGNAQPAFHRIAEDMRTVEVEQFASEGGHGSGGWRELAESTLRAKLSAGLDPHILRATGGLMRSLTELGGDHIEEISDDFMVFGSSVDYGKYHQKGTSSLPTRKPVEFTETDRRRFVRTLQQYIVGEGVA